MSNENDKQITPETGEEQSLEGKKFHLRTREIIPIVKEGYILRKVGQAYMVMPTGPRMKDYEGMITLNETGAFLFKEAQKDDTTPEKLIEACKTEYDATDEEAKQAVDMFIKQCADCGIFDYSETVYELDAKAAAQFLGRPVTEDDVNA